MEFCVDGQCCVITERAFGYRGGVLRISANILSVLRMSTFGCRYRGVISAAQTEHDPHKRGAVASRKLRKKNFASRLIGERIAGRNYGINASYAQAGHAKKLSQYRLFLIAKYGRKHFRECDARLRRGLMSADAADRNAAIFGIAGYRGMYLSVL